MSQALVSQHPAVGHKLTRLRAQDTPPELFRSLVRELAQLVGMEATTDLRSEAWTVQTPLAPCQGSRIADSVALVPILRAGLGMVEGLLDLLPQPTVRHLGFYRDEDSLQPVSYYNKLSDAEPEDVCLVLDPMLATGGSAVAAIDALKEWGAQRIKFLGLVGAPAGVEALQAAHPDVPIHLAGLDTELNDHAYIVPGLGDAGDRLYHT